MFTKKQYIILGIVFVFLAVSVFVFCGYYKHWSWQNEAVVSSPAVLAFPSSGHSIIQAKTEREKVMEDLADKISHISPVNADKGKNWLVERFWFVVGSDQDFYAEYQDGRNIRRILLSAELDEDGYKFNVKAYFEPGEADWILKTGKDKQFGKSLDLYEYDSFLKKWTKKN